MKELRSEQNVLVQAIENHQWDEVVRLASPELVNTYDYDEYNGFTPLMWAAESGAPEDVLIKIIDNASEECIKHMDNFGSTVLHRLLSFSRSPSALRCILAVNSDYVNTQDYFGGRTPLHWCLVVERRSFEEQQETAKILMEFGAIPTIKNHHGNTPIDLYKRNPCNKYDKNLKDEQKKELLKILEGGRVIPVEILARGSGALNAYVEALKEGETEVNQGRTIIMGLERVGKTSTIRSFLKKEFNPDEPITDAIATNKTCIQDSLDEWNEVTEDKSPVAAIFQEKVAEAIAEKVQKKQKKVPKRLKNKAGGTKKIKDSPQTSSSGVQSIRQLPENIASKAAEKMRFTDQANTTNERPPASDEFIMNIWDFGGQPIYNIIQRILISSFAVVCVVFNLEHNLASLAIVRDPTTGEVYEHRMSYLEYILYFIRSVYIHCRHFPLDGILGPPIILVGTHLNSLGSTEEERSSKAEEKLSKIRKALQDKPYQKMVFPEIFTIENSVPFNESGASDIMSRIFTFSKKMVRSLPLKWLLVQQEIQKLKKDKICLKTSEVIDLMKRCGIKRREDQQLLLQYLHDIGEVLYYQHDKALKDTVVVDLMRVVDLSTAIITVIDPKLQDAMLRSEWENLKYGILKERLLKHLWEKLGVKDESFDFFVSLLQLFGLICEKTVKKGEEREFYVLSRLKPEKAVFPTENYANRAISLFHDFKNYLPDDIFQRTVTKFIEKFQMENYEPKLGYELVKLNIDEEHLVILNVATIEHRRMFKTTIIRTRIVGLPDDEPKHNMCKKVLHFLNEELTKVCPSGRGVDMRMYIPCECCAEPHWHIVRKFDKEQLPCGSNAMSIKRYCRLFGEESMIRKVTRFFHGKKATEAGAKVLSPTGHRASEPFSFTDGSSLPIDRSGHKFRTFLARLSKQYPANNYRWLRFLLTDILPISILSKTDINGMYLFNELASRGHISITDVTILSDISDATGLVAAKRCVEAYKQETECKEGKGLKSLRKNLFKGLIDVAESDVHELTAYYNLGPYNFDNVWDLVFLLESRNHLNNREKWTRFASCLNERAKTKITDA